MNSTAKIVAGFLLGSICGLAAGLLMAPTTGKQARKKIGKKSKKLARKMAGYVGMEEKLQGNSAKRKDGKAPVEA
jgi:gas vesicle protein